MAVQVSAKPIGRKACDRFERAGTIFSSFSQRSSASASLFNRIIASSYPPTMSSVGDCTRGNASSARSGRPPRETTASIRLAFRAVHLLGLVFLDGQHFTKFVMALAADVLPVAIIAGIVTCRRPHARALVSVAVE